MTPAPRLCVAPELDVFVRLADSVYVGPAEGITEELWRTARVALPPPGLPCRLPGRVALTDLAGREAALAAHYAELALVLAAHGRTGELRTPFPHRTLRPAILCGGKLVADWVWSDGASDAAGVLDRLAAAASASPGSVLVDDQDQGWRLCVTVADAGMVELVEWDAEGPPPPEQVWHLPAGALAAQATAARHRLDRTHIALRRLMRDDPWAEAPRRFRSGRTGRWW